jgi:hypothetical protein
LRLLELPYLLDRNSKAKDMSPYPSSIPRGKFYLFYWYAWDANSFLHKRQEIEEKVEN